MGVTVPLPRLPRARSTAAEAPKLYAPPPLLEPVPTTYRPSAAAPVPSSVRYQPAGRTADGEVLLLSALKSSETPAGEGIETDPLPEVPAAQALIAAPKAIRARQTLVGRSINGIKR